MRQLGLSRESASIDLSDLPSKLPEAVASFRTGPTSTIGNSIPEKLPNIGDLAALREVEIKHGRAAMMGITGFAVQEALWGNPVVEQTPWLYVHIGTRTRPPALHTPRSFPPASRTDPSHDRRPSFGSRDRSFGR